MSRINVDICDSRLEKEILDRNDDGAAGFEDGFQFAIQRLRENAYYGHYAQFMADWLEKHLTQDVKSDKATDK